MLLFSEIFHHCTFHGIMKRKWDSESHLRVKVRFWMGIRLCHSKLLSHFRIHWEYSRYSWFTRQTAKKRKGSWSFFVLPEVERVAKLFFVYSGENAKKNRWVGFRDIEWIQYIHGYPMQLTKYKIPQSFVNHKNNLLLRSSETFWVDFQTLWTCEKWPPRTQKLTQYSVFLHHFPDRCALIWMIHWEPLPICIH